MSAVPDDPTCSICTRLGIVPSKDALRILTEARAAWCKLHLRKTGAPRYGVYERYVQLFLLPEAVPDGKGLGT